MKISEQLAQGRSLPRASWGTLDPRTQIVPAQKGGRAPYHRKPRRQADRNYREEAHRYE